MDFSYEYFKINGLTAPDPIAVASVINRNCVFFRPCMIDIDFVNKGVSIVKFTDKSNIKISTGVNIHEFRKLFKETFN